MTQRIVVPCSRCKQPKQFPLPKNITPLARPFQPFVTHMSTSLKDLVRDQIINQVIKPVQPANGWKVLVVDRVALRMISACCRMFDITECGVTIVEDLLKSRQPMPNFEVIYLCMPDAKVSLLCRCVHRSPSQNISLILKDFSDSRKPRYKAAHVYCIDG